MITFLIQLLIVILIIGVIYWVLDALPVPEPLNRIAKIVIVVIGVLVIVLMLLRLTGVDIGTLPR
jgi:hypothetical protein